MSVVLKLRGARALSDFRLARLLTRIQRIAPGTRRLAAEYWHFADADAEPGAAERALLERLLRYGEPAERTPPPGERFLVVPRLGTISPWSSKATDIARNCGLSSIRRIERGSAFFVESAHPAIPGLLHDRMTQTVLRSYD